MSDAVEDVKDKVDNVVPDAISETADHPVPEPPPEWAVELTDKVEDIADKLSGVVESSHVHEAAADTGDSIVDDVAETVAPDSVEDDDTPRSDSTPDTLPWTHKNPFAHKGD